MSAARWRYTQDYLAEVFGAEDEAVVSIRVRSQQANLAPIAVTSDVGRFLTLLARMAGNGIALEVGTLGGYSALHILRGLPRHGRLITIEQDPQAAEVARQNLAEAGVGDRVRCEVGSAIDLLPRLAAELGPRSVGFIFIDADKTQYGAYWVYLKPLLAEGGLLVADNVLGTRSWWIDQEDHASRIAVDAFNRAVASDPDLEVAGLLVRQGLLLARRR